MPAHWGFAAVAGCEHLASLRSRPSGPHPIIKSGVHISIRHVSGSSQFMAWTGPFIEQFNLFSPNLG